jgi:anti-sigma B factor antagonist
VELNEYKKNDFTVIQPKGSFVLKHVDVMTDKIDKLIGQRIFKIAIDLSETDQIDSSGIGVLVLFQRKLSQAGGEFFIFGVPANFASTITSSRINRIVKVVSTFEEGVGETRV